MTPRACLAYLARESRGARGRLAFFVACLAVGVAAVVAVAGLSRGLEEGLRREARELLAADLAVSTRQPDTAVLDEILALEAERGLDVETAEIVELATVVNAPGAARPGGPPPSQLVELKAVSEAYPFYGELELDPDRPLQELLDDDAAVVAPDLLARLGIGVGDELSIGGRRFSIAGTVAAEPDRMEIGLSFGPRVFLSLAGLERAELVSTGSRVGYRTLLRLPPRGGAAGAEATAALAERLRETLPPTHRVETYREAQPALRRGLRRVDRFLGLVALLSLLVGGIGVAETVRAWLASRLDSIAILKCLGVRPREIAALYLGESALLGLAGSVAGTLLGLAVLLALPSLLPDLVPRRLVSPWQPEAIARGLGLGVGVALLFSAPPLAAVWSVPPARVLRRDAEPLAGNRPVTFVAFAALAAGVWSMATLQSGSPWLGAQFVGGLAVAAAGLAVAAYLLARGAGRLARLEARAGPRRSGAGGSGERAEPGEGGAGSQGSLASEGTGGGAGAADGERERRRPRFAWGRVALRHGLAALGRPGAATLGAVVALGLGVLVVLAMALVERRLSAQIGSELPRDAPSAFLVDIQPHQWPSLERLLAETAGGEGEVVSVPVVMARLAAVDGTSVEELTENGDRGERWALTREQRLTYMEELPEDNLVTAGSLWEAPGVAEVSIEEDFADDLGVGLGSVLRFDVQGVPLELTVTSVRRVEWGTFGINFFLVVEPGVLDEAPQQRIATVRLPPGSEQELQDRVSAAYPNVTFLDLTAILGRILAILERIGLAVAFLGGFTVVAGIAILAGAVSATAAAQGREVALLKTLGMTRSQVALRFVVEHALVGLAAGVIGAVGGTLLAWAVATRGLEVDWALDPLPVTVAVVGSAVLAAVAGTAASSRALARRPVEALRAEI